MKKPGYFARLVLTLALFVLAAQAVIFFVSAERIRSWFLDKEISSLKDIASLVRDLAEPQIREVFEGQRKWFLIGLSARWSFRISLIGPHGQPLDDSILSPGLDSDTVDQPEINAAEVHDEGTSLRWSPAMEKLSLHYAEVMRRDGHTIGFIRVSSDAEKINQQFGDFFWFFFGLSSFCFVIVSIIVVLISRSSLRALGRLTTAARELTEGRSFTRFKAEGPAELRPLTEAFNNLLDRTETQLVELTRQKNQAEAVLEGMSEAVLLLDPETRIRKANSAAARLFPGAQTGRALLEVCRSSELHAFASRTLAGSNLERSQLIHVPNTQQFLQTSGTVLAGEHGQPIGAVLVITDVTQMKKLEQVRKDFVANVSHELKTPITNILGYVETLLESRDLDKTNQRNFLSVIEKHAQRMNLIISDLLSLSRLESQAQSESDFATVELEPVLRRSMDAVEKTARAKRLTIHFTTGQSVPVRGLPSLLEQAFVNLLENAVKFSPEDRNLYLSLGPVTDGVEVRFRDEGVGIPARDLDRVFERFFRSERSRSTEGTGLGLAIVKHIVLLHRGQISVTSTEGVGTEFRLWFPAGQP